MILNTKAFVLSSLKYGDNSLILRCYTEEFGFKNFILKNSFSKRQKKYHFIFMLNEIELSFYAKKNNALELVKEINQGYIFKSLSINIIKSSIVTFIGEILNQALKNEEVKDDQLYHFIKTHLIALDTKEKFFADFHLHFLLEFSKHIGFHPLALNSEFPYFNLKEGVFSLKPNAISKGENAYLWNSLLKYDFNNPENCFSSLQRLQMLEEILVFYDMHLTNFRRPISLDILKLIFE